MPFSDDQFSRIENVKCRIFHKLPVVGFIQGRKQRNPGDDILDSLQSLICSLLVQVIPVFLHRGQKNFHSLEMLGFPPRYLHIEEVKLGLPNLKSISGAESQFVNPSALKDNAIDTTEIFNYPGVSLEAQPGVLAGDRLVHHRNCIVRGTTNGGNVRQRVNGSLKSLSQSQTKGFHGQPRAQVNSSIKEFVETVEIVEVVRSRDQRSEVRRQMTDSRLGVLSRFSRLSSFSRSLYRSPVTKKGRQVKSVRNSCIFCSSYSSKLEN